MYVATCRLTLPMLVHGFLLSVFLGLAHSCFLSRLDSQGPSREWQVLRGMVRLLALLLRLFGVLPIDEQSSVWLAIPSDLG